jgi:hypothetical protein
VGESESLALPALLLLFMVALPALAPLTLPFVGDGISSLLIICCLIFCVNGLGAFRNPFVGLVGKAAAAEGGRPVAVLRDAAAASSI